jgi:hypothetical protein
MEEEPPRVIDLRWRPRLPEQGPATDVAAAVDVSKLTVLIHRHSAQCRIAMEDLSLEDRNLRLARSVQVEIQLHRLPRPPVRASPPQRRTGTSDIAGHERRHASTRLNQQGVLATVQLVRAVFVAEEQVRHPGVCPRQRKLPDERHRLARTPRHRPDR